MLGRSHAMKIHALLFAILTASLPASADDGIPLSLGWGFTYQGKEYDSHLSQRALRSSPSWSPAQPLPLSTSNAVEIARTQVATLTRDATSWQVSEIQILCASRSPTQRWYYAIHFQTTQRPFATTPGTTPPRVEEIVACVDFAGRPGVIKPKR